jgi:hypothetical protein
VNPLTLSTLGQLNDLRHAALDALKAKHKYPALLLLYSFIDICAAISVEADTKDNRLRFETFLKQYSGTNWETFTTHDIWAARSSLLHTFSPLGNHTKPGKGARPIFYFAWPEKQSEVQVALEARDYKDFLLLDVQTIKFIAIDCFNAMWRRVEHEPPFEETLIANSRHLLKDLFQMRLEDELVLMEKFSSLERGETDA